MRTAEETRNKQIESECEIVDTLITLAIKEKNNHIIYWLHNGTVEELKRLGYEVKETNTLEKYKITW